MNLTDLKVTIAVLVNQNNEIVDFDHVRGNRLNLVIDRSDVSFYHPDSEKYRSGDLVFVQEEISHKSNNELTLKFLVASKDGFSQLYTIEEYEKLIGKFQEEEILETKEEVQEITPTAPQNLEIVAETTPQTENIVSVEITTQNEKVEIDIKTPEKTEVE